MKNALRKKDHHRYSITGDEFPISPNCRHRHKHRFYNKLCRKYINLYKVKPWMI